MMINEYRENEIRYQFLCGNLFGFEEDIVLSKRVFVGGADF